MKASMEKRTAILVSSEKEFFELASILLKEGYYFRRNKEQFLSIYLNTYSNKTTDFKMLIYLNRTKRLTVGHLDRYKKESQANSRIVSTEEYLFIKNKKRKDIPGRIN